MQFSYWRQFYRITTIVHTHSDILINSGCREYWTAKNMLQPFIYPAAVTALVSNTIAQTTTTPIWFEGYYVNGQTSMHLCVNLWSTPNRTNIISLDLTISS
jgi:hypothetical protein